MFHHLFFGKKYRYGNTRQYLRLPASWPIKCEPKTPADGQQILATKDISAGGIAVVMREMIPVGSRIRLEIYIPPLGRAVRAEGQVVRCLPVRREGFELGIRFAQIEPQDQKALQEEIEKLAGPGELARQKKAWWRTIS